MIAVVQRVTSASVTVQVPAHKESIGIGMCVLLGIETNDDDKEVAWMAKKLSALRIFPDEDNKMNKSLIDVEGELLLISQFTLSGDCAHGNRPSFINAAKPELAEPLVTKVGELLQKGYGITVKNGVFGAKMNVAINNDGPVTIIVRRT
ncbi:MAG: D-aminoacyl-tRNA deacylase [Phycisphaerales bacterium]|jgi:D-tyrosyl-tRNA(Tyr) deacylase|nr:D-aminoacyl-tRNA deacylase [Phycisphaerales bacterium]